MFELLKMLKVLGLFMPILFEDSPTATLEKELGLGSTGDEELLKDFTPAVGPTEETEEAKTTRIEQEKKDHITKKKGDAETIEIAGLKIKKSDLEAHQIDLGEGRKITLADLKKGFMLNEDYTKKTQALSEEKEKIGDLIKFADAVRKNPKMVKAIVGLTEKGLSDETVLDKVLTALEGKIEEAKEDLDKLLEGIDPESPEGKIIKALQGQVKALETKVTQIEKAGKDIDTKITDKETTEAITHAQQVLNETLVALADPKKGGLEFDTETGQKLWRMLTISYLKDNPREYASQEDFVKIVNEVGKQMHAALQKFGEAKLKKYLETKKTPIPGAGGDGGEKPSTVTFEKLQEGIEKSLIEESQKRE